MQLTIQDIKLMIADRDIQIEGLVRDLQAAKEKIAELEEKLKGQEA